MSIRHRPDFKEALSTLRRLKNAKDQACFQNWWQSSSSSWWQWQDSWWHPSSETSPRRWTTLIERGNLRKSVNGLFAKITAAKFGNSQRSLLSPTGGVKRPPTTENWLRKLYKYSKKSYKSTEDNHETNHINNKYNDTNMNTRKMHNT